MRKANLVIEEMKRNVCTMAVCNSGHPFQTVTELVRQYF